MGDGRRPRLVVADLGGTLVNERGLVQGAIRRALGEADGDGDRPYLTTLAMERGGVTDRLAVANIGDTAHDRQPDAAQGWAGTSPC